MQQVGKGGAATRCVCCSLIGSFGKGALTCGWLNLTMGPHTCCVATGTSALWCDCHWQAPLVPKHCIGSVRGMTWLWSFMWEESRTLCAMMVHTYVSATLCAAGWEEKRCMLVHVDWVGGSRLGWDFYRLVSLGGHDAAAAMARVCGGHVCAQRHCSAYASLCMVVYSHHVQGLL